MTTGDDIAALVRACNQNPDDDTPRLVLADAIDEAATTDAERGRAELIRTQLGRRSGPHASAPTLIGAYEAAWRRPPCQWCEGRGFVRDGNPDVVNWRIRPQCRSTCSTGALSERVQIEGVRDDWRHVVTWVRGFPVVEVAFAEMGTTRTRTYPSDEHGPAEYDDHPWMFRKDWLAWAIRAVKEEGASFCVTGRDAAPEGWWSLDDNPSGNSWWLPLLIYSELGGEYEEDRLRSKSYKSPALAHAALDAAVTVFVVKRAYPKEKQ